MRRQWPCSKCGFACSSTWRSLNPSKPVICNACRSKGGRNKIVILPPKQVVPNNVSSSNPGQISSSSSAIRENMAFTVSQIGMIFGNLPFEPILATNPAVNLFQPKIKSEVDDHSCAIGFQCHFCCEKGLKTSSTSLLEDSNVQVQVQIKQEYDCEEALSQASGDATIWDTKKVQRKKRSKLPQYTLSPLARFINQLHQVSRDTYTSTIRDASSYDHHRKNTNTIAEYFRPKYDDFLIYEKCKYIGENEIGLGAMMVSSSPVRRPGESYESDSWMSIDTDSDSSSTSESDDANSNCLVDVPIKAQSE